MAPLLIAVVVHVALALTPPEWKYPSSIYAHSVVTVPFHAEEMD